MDFVRWVIRRRWPLSPLILLVVAVVAAQDRAANAPQVAVISALFFAGSCSWRPRGYERLRKKPRGHRLVGIKRPYHVLPFSLSERRIASIGFAGVLLWLGMTTVEMPGVLAGILLLAIVAHPTHQWVRSGIRRAPKLNKLAQNVLASWAVSCAPKVTALAGSKPLRSTLTELDAGGITVQVLLDGVHPNNAVTEQVRLGIEAALSVPPTVLPVDSVELSVARDDGGANRINVTITPTRHLELTATVWQGPILNSDGSMPVAQSVDGSIVHVNLFNDSGVESGLISGTSGGGKSNSGTVVTAPGVMACREILIYCDGGGGSSNRLMRQMATIDAIELNQWLKAIDIFWSVAESRKARWGGADEFGRDKYDFTQDPEPVVTLFLEEATQLRSVLPPEYRKRIAELQLIVRKLGMRIIQSTQSMRADQIIGDAVTRAQPAGNGFIIAHAVGSPHDAMSSCAGMKTPGIAAALAKVPSTPGMALIGRKGQVISPCARVFFTEKDMKAILDQKKSEGWKPLGFTDDDLIAAQAAGYGEVSDGVPVPSPMAPKSRENENIMKIYAALESDPEGLTSRQIIDLTGIADSTVYRLLKSMADLTKTSDGRYRLVESAATTTAEAAA